MQKQTPILFPVSQGVAALLLAFSWSVVAAHAQQPNTPPAPPAVTAPAVQPAFAYTRDARGTDGKIQAVQSAIRRFDPASGTGPTVYLVAAVHIGEKSYYQQLQSFLNKQDVVLYEGVKGTRAATGTAALNPVTPPAVPPTAKAAPAASVSVQKKLSDVLNLQFQLEGINYRQPNFRNSDLTWQQMEALADKSGAGTKQNLSELGNMLSGGPGGGAGSASGMFLSLLDQAKTNPAVAQMMRSAIVQLIADPAKIAAIQKQQGADQANVMSILIAERNKVVLGDLKSLTEPATADANKPPKSVAIFFGAEHMRDLEKHLVADMGYRAADAQWITAINAEAQKK